MLSLRIKADHECTHPTPVWVDLPAGVDLPPGPLQLVPSRAGTPRSQGGGSLPAQRSGRRLVTLVRRMHAGEHQFYDLQPGGGGAPGVRLQAAGEGEISIDLAGEPFTTYHYGKGVIRPYLHPVLGPDGIPVTRDFPMKNVDAERDAKDQDHPHHRSLWTAFDEVNEVDNWSENPAKHGYTRHREMRDRVEGPVFGGFTAASTWESRDGRKILDEVRTLRVYNAGRGLRLFDYDVSLKAAYGDVEFGDTKEGGILAVRVFHSLKEDEGGRMTASTGESGEKNVWGRKASWLDYSGSIGGRTVGIAMMDHPGNPNHPPRWHARAYGLVGVNPFSSGSFEKGAPKTPYHLKAGKELKFRYRVYIHPGDVRQAEVEEVYHCWIQPPAGRLARLPGA